MEYDSLFLQMEHGGNKEQASKMSAYMRNQFLFLGLPAPKRKNICKEIFRAARKESFTDWDFIKACWQKPYREFKYVAIDYLVIRRKTLTPNDLPKIKELATEEPWWDTIDGLDKLVGNIALNFPEINKVLVKWSRSDNLWLRRIAIDHQLLRKEKTNTKFLEEIIVNNLGQMEFFINKAIGWSLRDYSKTNPEWVLSFIGKYRDRLAPLSIKEANRYL
jgi:3-methyladenine DNA glycosylase AlkD